MREIERTVLQMGTIVHFRVIANMDEAAAQEAIAEAHDAFRMVESVCSRFDEQSELRQLSLHIQQPTEVSETLFQVLQFAMAMADETDGLFDPTIGRVLHSNGFVRHYLTGEEISDEGGEPGEVTYRDVILNADDRTVTLLRPMTLDLGAVAKGFAIDLAAKHLAPFHGFLIDAGGDTYVGGRNVNADLWQIGIRHPIQTDGILCTLQASDVAICTSGGYERRSPVKVGTNHLIHPGTGQSPDGIISSTVVAPYAMMADAFSTVTFLQGCEQGIETLERFGLNGILVDETMALHMTSGMKEYFHE